MSIDYFDIKSEICGNCYHHGHRAIMIKNDDYGEWFCDEQCEDEYLDGNECVNYALWAKDD